MASIIERNTGRYEVAVCIGDRRVTIRLGDVGKTTAGEWARHLDRLSRRLTHAADLPADTLAWMNRLGDEAHAKLSRVGLAEPRVSPMAKTVRAFLSAYLESRKPDIKPTSYRKLEWTAEALNASIGDKPLADVTFDDATQWRRGLIDAKLSNASVKTHTGNAKQLFRAAVRAGQIAENPFDHLRGGSTASAYTRYVEPDEFAKFLTELPSVQWRLMFALARYAGLRVPSESHLLSFADIDWDKGRMNVKSPKTEHHTGHESRMVPIDPRLMVLLRQRFDEAEPGESPVNITGNGYIDERFKAACQRANVTRWKRTFQTLRSSCEKEWAMVHPQYAVSKWIGHSLTVSGKHYANAVPDELFDKAARGAAESAAVAQQNAQQQATAPKCHGMEGIQKSPVIAGTKANRGESMRLAAMAEKVAGEGFEPTPLPRFPDEKSQSASPRAAECAAPEPDLARIIDAWPALPAKARAGILGIVARAKGR